jgi:hypothetical protein
MNKWIRPISAVLSAFALCSALHAAPQDGSRFMRERPAYTLRPPCTTGPAPQVQARVENVYVRLTWSAVPGATTYWIGRNVPARSGSGTTLTPSTFTATEFWDAVPDTREAYQYTVTAVQADGCTGHTAIAVPGPFPTPNPIGSGRHPSPTQVVLTWTEQFGATGYRVDGPGIPITGLYLDGTTFELGKKPAMIGAPRQVGINTEYELSAILPGQGVQGAWYSIVAVYPQAADYSNPRKIWVPRVQPVITGISPGSGTLGQTVVTITGQYLADPGDGDKPHVWFGVSQQGISATHQGTSVTPKTVSPTAITAVAVASGYVQVGTYSKLSTGGYTGSGHAVSPTAFVGMSAPPPPPEPPPQVLVPGVVGLSLTGAIQVLEKAGFVPAGGSGTAGPIVIVRTQDPQGGAKAPAGSTVTLTTVAQAIGYSKLTLYNNMQQQRSVNVWLFDQAAGAWSGGSAVGYGASTTLNLLTGRQYFVLALDPSKCGGQNSPQNSACEYWRLPGVPGDEKGPATTMAIN